MSDIFSKSERSRIMGLIKSKDTKIEKDFCSVLSSVFYPIGIRYRKHYSKLPGKPDIAFVKNRIAVFIDGDFWHGYKFKIQKQRLPRRYWVKKIENNINHDREVNLKLRRMGWRILRIWEHEIKLKPEKAIEKIVKMITKNKELKIFPLHCQNRSQNYKL